MIAAGRDPCNVHMNRVNHVVNIPLLLVKAELTISEIINAVIRFVHSTIIHSLGLAIIFGRKSFLRLQKYILSGLKSSDG